jgi:hypothetical protein
MTPLKRSSAVPLSLVPALAALTACDNGPQVVSGVDPCLPEVYNAAACQYSVGHNGYWYGGMWYHHVYSMPFMYYHNGYSGYIGSGGRVRVLSPGAYSPGFRSSSIGSGSRTTVVRGGFGGIGGARGFGGS